MSALSAENLSGFFWIVSLSFATVCFLTTAIGNDMFSKKKFQNKVEVEFSP